MVFREKMHQNRTKEVVFKIKSLKKKVKVHKNNKTLRFNSNLH